MITGKNIVMTGLQPWDINIGFNAKDIALEFARHNRVLYVNTPLDVTSVLRGDKTPETERRKAVCARRTPALRQISESLWVLDIPFAILPLNFLPDGVLFDAVNWLNSRAVYGYVRRVLRRLGFEEHILFIDNDIYRSQYAKRMLGSTYALYYRRDNMKSDYWKGHAPRLEPRLCANSDCVVANSIQLANAVREYNPHCYFVGQGVNLEAYDPEATYPMPDSLRDIPRPIVGYVGLITSLRIDADLVAAVAKRLPNCSFVMIGSEDDRFKAHSVHSVENVYFLGSIPPDQVPRYMSMFDVCLNPQLVNDITIGNYPRKVDEYLSLGKPTVATRTQTMAMFEPCVTLCDDAAEYAEAIERALQPSTTEQRAARIAMARSHTWECSVGEIYKHFPQS